MSNTSRTMSPGMAHHTIEIDEVDGLVIEEAMFTATQSDTLGIAAERDS